MQKIYNTNEVRITDEKGREIVRTKEQLQESLDKMKKLQDNIESNIANIEYDLGEIAKI
jgi:uncharacterized protein YfcZ (UPF0381/DUF406 family)